MKEIKRLIRCEQGHFFDGGKYDECPHCNNSKTPDVTVFVGEDYKKENVENQEIVQEIEESSNAENNTFEGENDVCLNTFEDVYSNIAPSFDASADSFEQDAENYTVHYFQKSIGTEPVVGWLVCVKGVHFGEDFKIKSGRNFIGRSGNMNISLSADKAVSRDRHAILTYDPKGNAFFIQPGESSELCYVNNDAVLVPTKLKLNDKITIGESELIFVPFCSKSFSWEKSNN